MSMRTKLDAVASLLDDGCADSAVKMLRGAWEPDLPDAERLPLYCVWIRALCETGELDAAKRLAERAVEEFPRDPDVLIAAGNVYDLLGELEQARSVFERAIKADPSGALQHYNLGAVLERMEAEDEAHESYRNALSCDGEQGAMFEASAALGAQLRRQGHLHEAAEVYENYLDHDPINVDLIVEHAICLSDLEEFDDAIERFRFALSLDAEHTGALYNLAITLYRTGFHDEARETMVLAHRSEPGSPLTLAVLGAWMLHDEPCDLDEALRHIYLALENLLQADATGELAPGYADLVVEEVFEALWQHERRAEAREIARVAMQRDWITSHILETLNEADHGRAEEALAFTVTARAIAGEAPEHWPRDAEGYTAGFTVIASDEDEARRFTLEFLRTMEPSPGVRFHVELVGPGSTDDYTGRPVPRGVVRVNSSRAYFRS